MPQKALSYQVVNSDIEAERDHLRVGDHIVRVLTMKEAINETRPLVLDALLSLRGSNPADHRIQKTANGDDGTRTAIGD
jgi:hypothetical protein